MPWDQERVAGVLVCFEGGLAESGARLLDEKLDGKLASRTTSLIADRAEQDDAVDLIARGVKARIWLSRS